MKKRFSQFVKESKDNKKDADTEYRRVKDRHKRERDDLRHKQDNEIDSARQQDFDKQEKDRQEKRKRKEVQNEELDADLAFEALEIGTPEIVTAYKKATPGQ